MCSCVCVCVCVCAYLYLSKCFIPGKLKKKLVIQSISHFLFSLKKKFEMRAEFNNYPFEVIMEKYISVVQ